MMTPTPNAAPKQEQNVSNLVVRAITALVAGPIVIWITVVGGIPFMITGLLLAALSFLEFCALGSDRDMQGSVIIGMPAVIALIFALIDHRYLVVLALLVITVVADLILEWIRHSKSAALSLSRMGLTLAGLIYAGLPAAFLIELRALPNGLIWILLIFGITWGTDTLAYFGGRRWGKRPLAPRISPKKTVEGAAVGVVGGFVLGLLVVLGGNEFSPLLLPLLMLGPPVAVIGDLFESRLKRFFHVGDSHIAGLNIIPGHGGVLDRTDALIWVTTLCYVYLKLVGLAG